MMWVWQFGFTGDDGSGAWLFTAGGGSSFIILSNLLKSWAAIVVSDWLSSMLVKNYSTDFNALFCSSQPLLSYWQTSIHSSLTRFPQFIQLTSCRTRMAVQKHGHQQDSQLMMWWICTRGFLVSGQLQSWRSIGPCYWNQFLSSISCEVNTIINSIMWVRQITEPATEDDFSAVDLVVEIETALQKLRRRRWWWSVCAVAGIINSLFNCSQSSVKFRLMLVCQSDSL